jgi:CRP-like cAMP-binding protein
LVALTKVSHNVGMNHTQLDAANAALANKLPDEAVAHLAAYVASVPKDSAARMGLAIALGDAGNPQGALSILRAMADRLAHDGYLLAALTVIKQGLAHAPDDASLLSTLKRIHVRGVRAKAGELRVPPPLEASASGAGAVSAESLLGLDKRARLEKAAEIGRDLGPAGGASIPLPMPLFCELDPDAFVETVKRMRLRKAKKGETLLAEGAPGASLLVTASGHVKVYKNNAEVAKVGPGMVLGEIALITRAPRTATVVAHEDVEYFELSREDIEVMAEKQPQIAEELLEFCRKRLIGNLLNTSPLFKRFDEMTRYTLIDRFARKSYQPGQKVIEEGKPGEGLFVVAAGEVQVSVTKDGDQVVVAKLTPGNVVGEISLLNDSATTATVTAVTRVGALFLPREEFQKIVEAHPSVRTYLATLSADRLKASDAAKDATEIVDADDLIVS